MQRDLIIALPIRYAPLLQSLIKPIVKSAPIPKTLLITGLNNLMYNIHHCFL